jgi:hypothetical protein
LTPPGPSCRMGRVTPARIKILAAAVLACFAPCSAVNAGPRSQSGAALSGPALEAFLDRAAERFKTLADLKDWSARVVSTRTEMDRNWTPETVTVIKKDVMIAGGEREEKILEAHETKDGRTRDITIEYAAEAQKNRERERERRAEESARSRDASRSSRQTALEDILPFSAKKRPEYIFRIADDETAAGSPALIVHVQAKVKDAEHWEGRLWFDAVSADLLQADIRPAKMPTFVKEIEMRVSFQTLPSGSLALRSLRIKINAGFFLKRVRQVVEEEYSDYVVR